jgi:hypothetical protein
MLKPTLTTCRLESLADFYMAKKSPAIELSISPRIAGRYAAAAKRLQAKSTADAPTPAELISRELMLRTPEGIVEDFEQGSWRRRSSNCGSVVVKRRS